MKPLTPLSLAFRDTIVHTILLNNILMKSKTEMDQFLEGMDSSGLVKAISENRQLLSSVFIIGSDPLTSGNIIIIIMITLL